MLNYKIVLILTIILFSASLVSAQELTGYPDERIVPVSFTKRWVEPAAGLNLRSKAGMDGKVIAVLKTGTRVEVLEKKQPEIILSGESGFWLRVKSTAGEGWCFSGFLRPYDTNNLTPNEENIIGVWCQPEGLKIEFTAEKDYYSSLISSLIIQWRFDADKGIVITAENLDSPGAGRVNAKIDSISSNRLVLLILGMKISLFRLKTDRIDNSLDTLAN
jgi:hypothetical protein